MRPDGAQVISEVTGDATSTSAPGRCTVHQCPRSIPLGEGRGTVTLAGAARACTGSRIRFPGKAGKEIII